MCSLSTILQREISIIVHFINAAFCSNGKESKTENFTCECGYKKTVVNDENKNVTITYSK